MTRSETLMPGGVPRYVRIYDNGGATFDRYTAVFTGRYRKSTRDDFFVRGMSADPYHPQGFGISEGYPYLIDARKGWAPAVGRKCHLGTRIRFEDLPEPCRRSVVSDYRMLWGI